MNQLAEAWWLDSLRCPSCHAGPIRDDAGVRCGGCGRRFETTKRGALALIAEPQADASVMTRVLPPRAPETVTYGRPQVTYRGASPERAPHELVSLVQDEGPSDAAVLDIGCGAGEFRGPLEGLGRRYVGMDIADTGADIQGDAQNIPFADEAFDAVLFYAGLQYCRNPFVALREISRVLRPEGIFVGTISLCEPFASDYFRATHLGLLELVAGADLQAERIWACRDALAAYASYISPYPRVVKWLLGPIERLSRIPVLSPRRWLEATKSRERLELESAGSLGLLARKPDGARSGRHGKEPS